MMCVEGFHGCSAVQENTVLLCSNAFYVISIQINAVSNRARARFAVVCSFRDSRLLYRCSFDTLYKYTHTRTNIRFTALLPESRG